MDGLPVRLCVYNAVCVSLCQTLSLQHPSLCVASLFLDYYMLCGGLNGRDLGISVCHSLCYSCGHELAETVLDTQYLISPVPVTQYFMCSVLITECCTADFDAGRLRCISNTQETSPPFALSPYCLSLAVHIS